MRVIKDPEPISWSIEKTCVADVNYDDFGCGAVLEVDYTDIYLKKEQKFRSTGDWGEGYTETVKTFVYKCPCCNKENAVKFTEIPDKIRKIIYAEEEKKTETSKKKVKK